MLSKWVFLPLFMLCASWAHAQHHCEKPRSVMELGLASVGAERAFANFDREALLKHATRARDEILPCLNAPLTSLEAAAFHRLMALEAFTRQDDASALVEFHAARKLFPGYVLPSDLAPADHPLRKLYVQSAQTDDGPSEVVYPPEKGYALVGCVRNAPRFKNAPVIVQVFAAGDRLVETRYVKPGETMPHWGVNNPLGVTAMQLGIDTTPTWRKPTTWWIASGVASAVALGFYGAAQYEKHAFNDRGTPDGDLRGIQGRANAFGYTSVASAGLAVLMAGLGVGMQLTFGDGDTGHIEATVFSPITFGEQGYVGR